jgi:putative glutamine amidotransferase
VVEAHSVRISQASRLSQLLPQREQLDVQVNSSHHQAIRVPGDKLLVSAVSPQDGVIEAVELDTADHFVLGVQWHPERTYTQSAVSRAIFAKFVQAAEGWHSPRIEDWVSGR